ncbi:MAG TPA: transglutaminaseTgpA domain-containing protein [Acidimicrobiales bacterium]|nr:transglutaminaseTgpA domain-containing protein [Acidimicrobiales bacterium]
MSADGRALALAGALAAAGLGWVPVFAGRGFAAALAGAAVLSVLGATALARTRLPAVARWAVLAGAGVVYAAAVGERSAPTPAAVGAVLGGVRDGWAQVLDATLPAPSTGGAMVTAVVLVWVAGVASAGALRAGHPARALLGPVAVLAAGLAFGAGGAVPALSVAGVVAAGAAVLLPARARASRRLGAAGLVVAVAATVVVVGGRWPGAGAREPWDPRRLRDQPVRIARPPNPLAALGATVSDRSDPVEFRARVEGPIANWRLVVLDRFDGQRWSSTATFRRVGAGLPAPDPDAPAAKAAQHVRLERLPGPFLPAASSPVSVAAVDGVAADADGVLVVPSGVSRPAEYRVTSAVPAYQAGRIEASAPAPAVALPAVDGPVRARLLRAAAQATAGANPSAAGTLQAMAVWFSTHFTLATGDEGPVPTGNGLFQITRLLQERTGTAEQFASAFAVLARLRGYQSRVVVGFRPGRRDRATGELVVRAHDAHAWPEVRFEGIGWVAFEPTPTDARAAAEAADLGDPATPGAVRPGLPATAAISPVPPTTLPDAHPGAHGGAAGAGRHTVADRVGASAAGLAALVLLAAAAVLAAKEARRRRQRSGPPAERVAGAWSASLDRLAEAGLAVPAHLAAAEVAGVESLPPGVAGALVPLAASANAARFSGQSVGDADADAAWAAHGAVAVALRDGRSLPSRARLTLSPAPLVRR